MIEKKMINKHILTCSVTLVLTIIFQLSFGTKITHRKSHKSHKEITSIPYISNPEHPLNFADETLPSDTRVNGKMQHSLTLHSYKNLHTQVLHRKAEKIFPVIEPILLQYGIPDDFKFIPLVESGFGEGKSSRGAYGPWQFMAGTARTYGLRVNKHQDERSNVAKATIAACKYLLELHQEFNSWTLVAAAYNTGSINLARLIRRQRQDNYYRIKMNSETGKYVYNLIAMKEIINDPQTYGYKYHKPMYAYVPQYEGAMLAFN